MKTYKSKIGIELWLPLFIILSGVGGFMIYQQIWPGAAMIGLVSIFIIHLFSTTYYQIEGDKLRIKSGLLVDKTLPINSIRKIIETRNPLSSPALSLDRMELRYNKFDHIIISPEDKAGFIEDLLAVKPDIEVSLEGRPAR